MLLVIPDVLPRDEALAMGRALAETTKVDAGIGAAIALSKGAPGSGWAAIAGHNRQVSMASRVAQDARIKVEMALARNATFLSAALPRMIYPPMFNRYGPGDGFGAHIDDAIRRDPAGAQIRTDLSATLFLSEGYQGGKLTIDGPFGPTPCALPAGHMVLYSGTTTHKVSQVTAGERLACFFWLQSLVRDDDARETLYDLDQSVQAQTARHGADDDEVLRLTRVYHRLIRMWAKC